MIRTLGAALAASALTAGGAVAQPSAPAPSMSLLAGGATRVEHYAADPLLLMVTVYNSAARAIREDNREKDDLAGAMRASDRFRQLSDEERARILAGYRPEDLPSFQLGSARRPVARLVSFAVRGSDGADVSVPVRALAVTERLPGSAALDADTVLRLYFGIDPDALGRLPAGTYHVAARLDSRSETGMWQGRIESPELTLTLRAGDAPAAGAAALARLSAAGAFYLRDRQFPRAEQTARRMMTLDPAAAAGWVLLGDAQDAQGRRREALETFFQALDVFHKANPDGGAEPPAYIEQRIAEIQVAIGRG